MLGKLLKYDFKIMMKRLVIFYGLATFFALLTRLFFSIENSLVMSIIGEVCQGAMISMMCSSLVNNVMFSWVRFKMNFYGDESYLTHTLPVTKTALYNSKILCSISTLFISMLVIVVNLFLAYYSKEKIEMIKNFVSSFAKGFDISAWLLITLLLLVIFVELANILQSGFSGIILGHRMNNAKTGFSVLYGFIVYMVGQIFIVVVTFVVALFDKDFMNLFKTAEMVNLDVAKTAVYMAIISYIVLLFIVYLVNVKLFKKGVNVD